MFPEQESSTGRLQSIDAYRGFVMLAMASGGAAALAGLAESGDSALSLFLQVLSQQLEHVLWRGCTFWDLIQPSFMFLVGVAMPFSHAHRRARGDSWLRLFGHALVRSLVLVALAVFLASHGRRHTDYSFVNVLGQIGLGYTFVYVLLGRRPAVQLAAAVAILAGYWLLFAFYPLPGPSFVRNLGTNEPHLVMRGFFAHWNKNTNPAALVDRWFLNLFPHSPDHPFEFNAGGYATLNFVPSIATMLFGVLAGELLRSNRGRLAKARILLLAGAACWVLGQILDAYVCPSVKRIWTPTWVVASTAWTCWLLGAFYFVIDVAGYRRWSFPLVVVGMNSIAIYLMSQLMKPFVHASLRTHFGWDLFAGPYGPLIQSLCTLLVFWLICLWLYRQKMFIKI
ncbi:MAG: acyltransferase family protein [Isosphaerales bacterium]